MRYLPDKELYQYVERELLPGLAEDCAVEFYERFGVLLDGSAVSLEAIDAVLSREGSLTGPMTSADQEALCGPVGAYLGEVLSRTDGARWAPAFDRSAGVDGYRASLLRLYDQEVNVFELAQQALLRKRTLARAYRDLHRSFR